MRLEAFCSGIGVAAEADEQPAYGRRGISVRYNHRVAAAKCRSRIGMRCPDDINVDACPLGNADEFFFNRRIAAGKRPLSPSSGRLPRPEPDGRSVFPAGSQAAFEGLTAGRGRCILNGRRRNRLPADAGQHVAEQMTQRGKLVERHAVVGGQPILLADLAKELRLADAIDPEVRLQIRIQLHDLTRIACLLHHEVDQERFQFRDQARVVCDCGDCCRSLGMTVGGMTVGGMTVGGLAIGGMAIGNISVRLDGRGLNRCGHRRSRVSANTGQHVAEQVTQRGKLVERHAVVCGQPILLANLTKELRLADAIDPKVRLQIRIQFHDLPRISRLLHHEVDQERFQLRRQTVVGCGRRCFFRRPAQQPSGLAARPGEHVTERVPARS